MTVTTNGLPFHKRLRIDLSGSRPARHCATQLLDLALALAKTGKCQLPARDGWTQQSAFRFISFGNALPPSPSSAIVIFSEVCRFDLCGFSGWVTFSMTQPSVAPNSDLPWCGWVGQNFQSYLQAVACSQNGTVNRFHSASCYSC